MALYHVHVDAYSLTDGFREFLTKQMRFRDFQFQENPAGIESFAPRFPFTFKTKVEEEFARVFDNVRSTAVRDNAMVGYIEGELVVFPKAARDRWEETYEPTVKPPFRFTRKRMTHGDFRESEIHLTLDREGSAPQLLEALRWMGFFVATSEKTRGLTEIYTVQGTQEQIDRLREPLIGFLEAAGGSRGLRIKEERVVRWWKSTPEFLLPPVVDRIRFL